MYNRSSISGDPNSIFSNNLMPNSSGAISNPYNLAEASKHVQDSEIWRANPLYMETEELEKDWDEEYEASKHYDYATEPVDDDPIDMPVDLNEEYVYDDDKRGLIQ